MSYRDTEEEPEGILNELDGVLPGEIDRRKFLRNSAGLMGAMMFAGCTGGGGGGGGGDTGGGTSTPTSTPGGNGTSTGTATQQFMDDTQVSFTTPWKKEPSWGTTHVAEGKGYWERVGVPGVKGTRGQGSDAEIQNIGVGNVEMGIASLTTAINFLPGTDSKDPLNVKIVALAKGRPLISLIWRKDKMNSRSDIAGKSVYLASGFASASWPIYPQLVGVPESKVSASSGTETAGPVKLAENQVQAVWGSIDLFPEYQKEVDAELGVTPLTAFGDFYGFPIWVNSNWYENKENNVEFTAHVLTGYFKALKWVLTNQEKYLNYMQNEVNSNLKTWTKESLTGQYSALCAQAVNPVMKDKGLGYFTQQGVEFAFKNAGPALLPDSASLRSANKVVDKEPWKASEKVTFSDSEWETLKSNAEPIWKMFAGSGGN
jgi:ABC-type nitrate/sulfonate/bicarbonate transport system substrate-binding protein